HTVHGRAGRDTGINMDKPEVPVDFREKLTKLMRVDEKREERIRNKCCGFNGAGRQDNVLGLGRREPPADCDARTCLRP
ncbi:hypothetical protein RRG08_011845, partial [Elysia crispata]